jgi:hypothetical protein
VAVAAGCLLPAMRAAAGGAPAAGGRARGRRPAGPGTPALSVSSLRFAHFAQCTTCLPWTDSRRGLSHGAARAPEPGLAPSEQAAGPRQSIQPVGQYPHTEWRPPLMRRIAKF